MYAESAFGGYGFYGNDFTLPPPRCADSEAGDPSSLSSVAVVDSGGSSPVSVFPLATTDVDGCCHVPLPEPPLQKLLANVRQQLHKVERPFLIRRSCLVISALILLALVVSIVVSLVVLSCHVPVWEDALCGAGAGLFVGGLLASFAWYCGVFTV